VKPVPATPLRIAGPAGVIEAVIEDPGSPSPAAFAVVCHPNPVQGGTMQNKVVTTVARVLNARGLPTLRFNYRGVGASEGSFDDGRGETLDALAVVAEGRRRWPDAALWLAGFSFGGVVALQAAVRVQPSPVQLITIAPALDRYFTSAAQVPVPPCPWLLVQGDADDVLDAPAVLQLARSLPQPPRLAVLPDVGHFFHGKLAELADTIAANLP
jgi:alpha/beta superfamily hydrolase